jgi:hypothetical protein
MDHFKWKDRIRKEERRRALTLRSPKLRRDPSRWLEGGDVATDKRIRGFAIQRNCEELSSNLVKHEVVKHSGVEPRS